ncbi:MAG: hypothetical protein Ct9H300mP1_29710 [Planctomycetaceae bacterium]|nr:MAG: hypothetical protein Ct9H300mP1_29710 [Planctomycetaceae bacterium]
MTCCHVGTCDGQVVHLRSLHHTNAGHSAGDQFLFTGHPPGPDPTVNIHPSCGSIVSEQLGHLTPELPPYVMTPRQVPGTDSAYLGVAHKPFETLSDPGPPTNLPTPEFLAGRGHQRPTLRRPQVAAAGIRSFPQGCRPIWTTRRDQRLPAPGLRHSQFRPGPPEPSILTPNPAVSANATGSSNATTRWTRDAAAPVPFATAGPGTPPGRSRVRWSPSTAAGGNHVEGVDSMKNGFLPAGTRVFRGDRRHARAGPAGNNLVVAWGEFGRTPKLNKTTAGTTIPTSSVPRGRRSGQGGRVVGSSDSKGAYP